MYALRRPLGKAFHSPAVHLEKELSSVDLQVRYTQGDNTFLRFALFDAWKCRCYWCSKPVDFTVVEIDHIVPKDLAETALKEAVSAYGLRVDYDLHAPYNLAPICRPCNGSGQKGDLFLIHAPVILSQQKKAEKHADHVIKEVQKMRDAPVNAKSLIAVAEMSLEENASRNLFEEFAPTIVQKMANISQVPLQYLTTSGVVVHPDRGTPYVDVVLDDSGRTTRSVIIDVIGQSFDDLVRAIALKLVAAIQEIVDSELEEHMPQGLDENALEYRYSIWLNFPDQIIVDLSRFSRQATEVNFSFGGSYFSEHRASVFTVTDERPREFGHSTVSVSAEWSARATWNGKWLDMLEVGEISLSNAQAETTVSW